MDRTVRCLTWCLKNVANLDYRYIFFELHILSRILHGDRGILSFCSEYMPLNAGVSQGCVLSPTLFFLHNNNMLEDSRIHCYANDHHESVACSTVDSFTPASQVFPGKTPISAEINVSLLLKQTLGMFPHGVKGI